MMMDHQVQSTQRASARSSPAVAWALCTGLAALAALPVAAAESVDADARFQLEAELRPVVISSDGRFSLEASARFVPEFRSEDGRFALQPVNVPLVGCDPLGADEIFADRFQPP